MKTVLVTGASSGLGLSHAVYLVSRGYDVYGTSRRADKLKREELREIFTTDHAKYRFAGRDKTRVTAAGSLLPERIGKNLDRCLEKIRFVTMDVSDDRSVAAAVKKITAADRVDVLVNNAGYLQWGAAEETPVAEARRLFETDYFGPLRVALALLPHFKKGGGGRIVNTSSLAALVGLPFMVHYSAAKAGLERLTEALRVELEPFGVLVSSLLPGDINTRVNSNLIAALRKDRTLRSVDVDRLLAGVATPSGSPYRPRSQAMWEIFVRNHIVAPPPLVVSRLLEKVIVARRPKVHYTVGSFTQAQAMKFLRWLLTDDAFLKVLKKSFGI
jgi:NAD(P)-dependent dehydrogenase (short-subunit alcohol dehydrogenase family)